MESATEVRYAGVLLGRASELREASAAGAFVVLPEPLPVGTAIVLKTEEGERAARVIEVIESADPNAAGMRVRFGETSAPAAAPPGTRAPEPVVSAPPTAAVAAPAPAAAPAPPSAAAAPIEAPTAPPSPEGDPAAGGGGRRRRRRR